MAARKKKATKKRCACPRTYRGKKVKVRSGACFIRVMTATGGLKWRRVAKKCATKRKASKRGVPAWTHDDQKRAAGSTWDKLSRNQKERYKDDALRYGWSKSRPSDAAARRMMQAAWTD